MDGEATDEGRAGENNGIHLDNKWTESHSYPRKYPLWAFQAMIEIN